MSNIPRASDGLVPLGRPHGDEITALFRAAFTASEGAAEGAVIAALATVLASTLDDDEVLGLGALRDGSIVGAVFFTRLRFKGDLRVYMLAPVAVAPGFQGLGIGQALIRHGLEALRQRCVAFVVTYGDPGFYGKVGFEALSEDTVRAPLTLSMPFGWLGQSLTGDPIPALADRPTCVEAFRDPAYW